MESSDPLLLNLSFTFRGRPIHVSIGADSTAAELGHELQSLTGADPATIKLLLPHGLALNPFSQQNAALPIRDCGIKEGRTIRMMGASTQELVQVSQASQKERVLGFDEEERRARQRLAPLVGSLKLPQGPYVFAGFQTLQLPGVEMVPPPARALELMHSLASDRGIVAIMNKHRWRVGVMTEMAPEGLVGISPKCLLGLNKNHGEEISLRLRTDDLKGFRKYESIKKTLLHELAHMVYGEHDDDFYRLDRQLNKEANELDWTKSRGQTTGEMKHRFEEEPEISVQVPPAGYRLGGASTSGFANVKLAAANAALNRLEMKTKVEPDNDLGAKESTIMEPDPDDGDKMEPDPDDSENIEPDPDDAEIIEPDPDDSEHEDLEPDPDDEDKERAPDNNFTKKNVLEPDPDDKELENISEPDPDDKMELDSDNKNVNNPELPLDGELGRIQDAAAAATSRLQQLITKLKLQASPPEAVTTAQTLVKILSNVMEHPNEDKYRRLKKSNPVFQQRVARFEGAVELLKMVGFTEEAKECFILKHNDPGLLWLARSSLEALA